jgi:hypothetical protein
MMQNEPCGENKNRMIRRRWKNLERFRQTVIDRSVITFFADDETKV